MQQGRRRWRLPWSGLRLWASVAGGHESFAVSSDSDQPSHFDLRGLLAHSRIGLAALSVRDREVLKGLGSVLAR